MSNKQFPSFNPDAISEVLDYFNMLQFQMQKELPEELARDFDRAVSGQILSTTNYTLQKEDPLFQPLLIFQNQLNQAISRHGVSTASKPLWERYLSILLFAASPRVKDSIDQAKQAVLRVHQLVPFSSPITTDIRDQTLEIDEESNSYTSQYETLHAQLQTANKNQKLHIFQQIFALEQQLTQAKSEIYPQRYIASRFQYQFEISLYRTNFNEILTADIALRCASFQFTPIRNLAQIITRTSLEKMFEIEVTNLNESSKREIAVGVIQRGNMVKESQLLKIVLSEILTNSLRSDVAEIVLSDMAGEVFNTFSDEKTIVEGDQIEKIDQQRETTILYLLGWFLAHGKFQSSMEIVRQCWGISNCEFWEKCFQVVRSSNIQILEQIFTKERIEFLCNKFSYSQKLMAQLYYRFGDAEKKEIIYQYIAQYHESRQNYLEYLFFQQCGFVVQKPDCIFMGKFTDFCTYPALFEEINKGDYYQIKKDHQNGFRLNEIDLDCHIFESDSKSSFRVYPDHIQGTSLFECLTSIDNEFFKPFSFTGLTNIVKEVQFIQTEVKSEFADMKLPPSTPRAVANLLDRTKKVWSEPKERSCWKQLVFPWQQVIENIITAPTVQRIVSAEAFQPIGSDQ
ncbi:hypothetical protein SS50377_24636 [Spironucleus salmonicida]|uniref:Uncharacterized protein n=1 Tax=Spironucleus salmonicida TaxID=348837 RepID=V6LUM9_9EUKA|nr:hypothetical protein SS50377_24636 [Spironucleus salmonicida]|eukprot:EST44514.1 Hypothetical protein SS50377_15511 [Spironucleus salmonicida]